ncbi:MAG: hypothetical protein IRZ13_19705, partial [Acetobacteraceae bacterium]|nr:hypothetical protein [Acetobacteraceae bacterium]
RGGPGGGGGGGGGGGAPGAGVAPPVLLEATHLAALEVVRLEDLRAYALDAV